MIEEVAKKESKPNLRNTDTILRHKRHGQDTKTLSSSSLVCAILLRDLIPAPVGLLSIILTSVGLTSVSSVPVRAVSINAVSIRPVPSRSALFIAKLGASSVV